MASVTATSNDKPAGFFQGDWERRLADIVATMREMSTLSDPQEMVRSYKQRLSRIFPAGRFVAISRRGLDYPYYKITRSDLWKVELNPWEQDAKLPVFQGGLLGELLYGEEPRIIDDLDEVLGPDDPAAMYFEGQRSLAAVPHYDQGVALNMVVSMRAEPGSFLREEFPEWVWLSNLFGRATQNLVLSSRLKEAYQVVDRELKVVADLQRSLLPKTLPKIPTLDLAASYQTSQWAGGDYYDVFALPDDRWGLMIADVSGHGTPAAVMMAVTHSIAHTYPGDPKEPGEMLRFLNDNLTARYTQEIEAFVTAFYGIYDPATKTLTYASAGHNPPRLKRCEDGTVISLDGVGSLPLGVLEGTKYEQATKTLRPGDQIIFYTDGITEANGKAGGMFGVERLDEALENCHLSAGGLIEAVLNSLREYTEGEPASDDRTMLVAKVS